MKERAHKAGDSLFRVNQFCPGCVTPDLNLDGFVRVGLGLGGVGTGTRPAGFHGWVWAGRTRIVRVGYVTQWGRDQGDVPGRGHETPLHGLV